VTAHYGSSHPQAKLEESDIHLIRELLAQRDWHRQQADALTIQAIADKFGVHEGTIRRIQSRRNWGHV